MKKLLKLNSDILSNEVELKNQTTVYNTNKTKSISARRLNCFLNQLQSLSTEFEPMTGFIDNDTVDSVPIRGTVDDTIYVLHHQFEVEIYNSDNILNELDFILPFIKYEVIYEDISPVDITYQNTHKDLQISDFYQIDDTKLILKVAIYMRKVYSGATLQIPNVKLRISLRNSIKLSN